MFQIGNIFFSSWLRMSLTVEDAVWTLWTVFVLTIVGILPAFFGTPIIHSFYLSFPIWIFSAYRIFRIWRYLYVAIAGEVLDGLQAIGPETNQTIWDSELAANYRKYAVNVWLSQTVIFLATPLYFNFTSGGRLWLPILIMVIFAIAMISVKAGLWVFRTVAVITVFIFLLFAGYDMFPQVGYVPFISEGVAKLKAGKLFGESARSLGEVNALRAKQRAVALQRVIAKTMAWQQANPGRDIPESLKNEMEATKLGLTVSEYQKQEKQKTTSTDTSVGAGKICKGKSFGIIFRSDNAFANAFPGGKVLEAGSYCLQPLGKVEAQFADEPRPRPLGNDSGFVVPPGKRVIGIRSDHQVEIFRE